MQGRDNKREMSNGNFLSVRFPRHPKTQNLIFKQSLERSFLQNEPHKRPMQLIPQFLAEHTIENKGEPELTTHSEFSLISWDQRSWETTETVIWDVIDT